MKKLRFVAWSAWILFFLFVCIRIFQRTDHTQAASTEAPAAASTRQDVPAPLLRGPTNAPSPVGSNRVFEASFLHDMRRRFNWKSPAADPALPADRQMLLVTRPIATDTPARSDQEALCWKQPSRRGTIPFLIQFDGSVTDAWQEEVRKTGAIMHHYMPNNGWMVELTPETRVKMQDLPMVRWIAAFEPADKIQPFLKQLMLLFPKDYRYLDVNIVSLSPDDTAPIRDWLTGKGLPVRAAEPAALEGGLIKASVTLDAIGELALRGDVQWIEEDVGKGLHNNLAVLSNHMNVTSVWHSYALTGRGQIVGHADTGLDIGSTNLIHPDFGNRILAAFALGRPGDWSDAHSHGTHTAGSIIGNGAMSDGLYRAPAWEARLVHQSVEDASGNFMGIPANLSDLFLPTYQLGARVHSDSWGSSVYGGYTFDSISADAFMWNNPDMLLVFSAGNEGADLYPANGVVDADSIGSPGTAKNLLTVGALESDRTSGGYGTTHTWGYTWYSDYQLNPIYSDLISISATASPYRQGMAAFSSRGPTDDGRIKPDVVASGTDVISCRSGAISGTGWGVVDSNTQYLYNGGTSMSCPLTAGAMLLIRQYLVERAGITNPSAALMKAMVVSGAKSMAPGQYGTGSYREIPNASPNMVEGFGQVDVGQSVYPTGLSVRLIDNQRVGLQETSNFVFTVAASGQPLSVALVWTDYPGGIQAGVKLVNDFDLTLTGPGISVLYPNGSGSADHVNPVEIIRISQAAAGDYTAHVSGHQIPQSGGRYALVIRAAMDQAPDLIHTPLPPVLATNTACAVHALLTYYRPATNGEFALYWTTNGPSGPFTPAPFGWQAGHAYTSAIPAQPIGTVAYYYLAATVSTHSVRYPATAPATVRQVVFANPLFTLRIDGDRTNSIVADPSYGTYTHPSGTWVRASVRPICYSNDNRRFVAVGWQGEGIIPASGTGSIAEFTLVGNGVLSWLWREQVSLLQNSDPPGAVNEKTWHMKDSTATTETAWSFASDGYTFYGLAGWKLDAVLWTNALGQAANPASLVMSQPRSATAWYLPYWTDSDGNGLYDWWEYRYSGALGTLSQNLDTDGDYWFNYYENLDDTDPWDADSFPTPPGIAVTSSTMLQTGAPPWLVTAVITDNCFVVDAAVTWRANGGPEQTTELSYMGNDVYQASLDPGLKTPVTILFRVHASDLVFESVSPLYTLVSHYPILRASPTNFNTIRLPRTGFQQAAQVANDGTAPLNWNALVLAPVMMDEMEKGTNGWNQEGGAWHLSKLRAYSPSNSWYSGSEITRLYASGMEAWLVTPPVTVGEGAILAVRHWMRAEQDAGEYYYDAGLVRISTDGGETFEDLAPLGGYPHRMVSSPGVPFAPGTPCFGSNDWTESLFDLSRWLGATVRIGFVFGSDSYVEREGWYIDDVWIGSESVNPWLTLTGTVTGVTPSGSSSSPFSLIADSLPFTPQAHVRGAIRMDHNGVGEGVDLLPFRLRRPAYVTTLASDPNGTITPPFADLLDGESTSIVTTASSGSRIKSLTTNGLPAAVFGIGSTNHVLTLSRPLADVVVRARFAKVWTVTLSVQGPGSATPSGLIPLDEGSSTAVVFQAQADHQIWNLVADGSGVAGAGGLSQYTWPVTSISTHHVATAAFGPALVTGAPVSVSAAWLRQYYPNDLGFDSLALLDTDGDGMETWKEYVCRTVPVDPESLLRILRQPELAGYPLQAVVHAQTVSGLVYRVQTAPAPAGPWTPIGDTVTATGMVSSLPVTLPPDSGKAFFRVLVLP